MRPGFGWVPWRLGSLSVRLSGRNSDPFQQILRLGFERSIHDGDAYRAAGEPFGLVALAPAKQGVGLFRQVSRVGAAIRLRVPVERQQLLILANGGLDFVGVVVEWLIVDSHGPGLLRQGAGATDVADRKGQTCLAQGTLAV